MTYREMIFFRASKYLKYIFFSRHRKGHGIHSPFIFDLVSSVFRNKIDSDIVFKIESIRKKMISDKRSVEVNDLGSGSERIKTNLRKVSEIAQNSPVPEKYGVLLTNLATEFGNPYIIEFGTSLGISTMYLAGTSNYATVYTMEGSPEISKIAQENFKEAGFNNIILMTGSFDNLLPSIKNLPGKPGLIFIDGNHRKEPLVNYFCNMSEVSDGNTVIIIDDIHYSKEMEEAWDIIKQDEKVSMTVDIWRMGMVFFRKGTRHFNYIIRY
jgi:predicted O-methyltransferase YrrM